MFCLQNYSFLYCVCFVHGLIMYSGPVILIDARRSSLRGRMMVRESARVLVDFSRPKALIRLRVKTATKKGVQCGWTIKYIVTAYYTGFQSCFVNLWAKWCQLKDATPVEYSSTVASSCWRVQFAANLCTESAYSKHTSAGARNAN